MDLGYSDKHFNYNTRKKGKNCILNAEAVARRCSVKMMFIEISQNRRKAPAPESLFNKVAGLKPVTLLKKRFWHRCFPVNFAKVLRTPPVAASVNKKFNP